MQSTLRFAKVVASRYQVERCTFSPDGNLLAACFSDYSVRVFSVKRAEENPESDHAHSLGRPHAALKCWLMEHQSNVWCIGFSPDSLSLCSCSSDMTVKVWDVQTEQLKMNFVLHSGTVWCCSFVPCRVNHPMIASGSGDLTVKLWNCENGKVVHNLVGYLDAVECLSFSHKGTSLCTGARDGTIKIWSNLFSSGDPTCLLLCTTNSWIRFCTFSWFGDHEELFATGGPDNAILLWDLHNIESEFSQPVANTIHVGSPDCNVVTTSQSHSEEVNVTSTELEACFLLNTPKLWLKGHLNTVWDCVFGHGHFQHNTVLISCSGDRTLRYGCMQCMEALNNWCEAITERGLESL